MNKGFTLIEIMAVTAITILLSSILILNFSRSRTDLEFASVFAGDAIREVQALALSGENRGELRCGYGIRFRGDGYDLYAGPPVAAAGGCPATPDFKASGVSPVRTASLGNQSLAFVPPFHDFFFAPPTPTTYADGAAGFGTASVTLCRVGTQDCRIISVTSSGVITTTK